MGIYAALVHHPIRTRTGETATTAITNLDVHDLARTCRTYDLAGFFVVTPVTAQRELARAILEHWREGSAGHRRVPERTEALARAHVVASVDEARELVAEREGARPRLAATAARAVAGKEAAPYPDARRVMCEPGMPWVILFGTGHGLADALVREADLLLSPVRPGTYNHLSVRAAAAILLDRLFGDAGAGETGP